MPSTYCCASAVVVVCVVVIAVVVAGICTTVGEHFASLPTNYCGPIDRLSARSEEDSTRQKGEAAKERKRERGRRSVEREGDSTARNGSVVLLCKVLAVMAKVALEASKRKRKRERDVL